MPSELDNFAVFILTHKRANNVRTYNVLRKRGYTGKIYLIVDNYDDQVDEYRENFGEDSVIIFNKDEVAAETDCGNNSGYLHSIIFVRNKCFDIANDLGIEYFVQMDDDQIVFNHRMFLNGKDVNVSVLNMDRLFLSYLRYYKSIDAKSIAMAQGGDMIGGIPASHNKVYAFNLRKCMNTFFCSVHRPFKFVGLMNEDVNTYTTLGSRGNLFLTIPFTQMNQVATQASEGGLTEMYLKYGTYVKSFYSVMMHPSSVKVKVMATANRRLHHRIVWKNTVPRIIRESYKK